MEFFFKLILPSNINLFRIVNDERNCTAEALAPIEAVTTVKVLRQVCAGVLANSGTNVEQLTNDPLPSL